MTDIEQLKSNPATFRCFASRLNLRKNGQFFEARCPFHDDDHPSFQVYEKNGVWMYTCQSKCGSGNAIQFVQKADGLSFGAAMKKVEAEVGQWTTNKELVERSFKPFGETPKEKISFTMEQYSKLERALADNLAAQNWLLKARGITYETAKRLHFGYRQDLGKIAGDSVNAAGGWIALPRIHGSQIVGIEYRSTVGKEFRRQPGMATALFGADDIDFLGPVYVVEGVFDAAVLEQAGFRAVSLPNATTKVTPEMKDQIMQAATVYLAGDTDPTGQAAMEKLWAELQERTYLLKWPAPCKDANETYLKDPTHFRETVERLTTEARSTPMPNVRSLQEVMVSPRQSSAEDDPNRLHFPWPAVDKMVNLVPTNVLALYATQTGQGKTSWAMNVAVAEARRGEVVLNYSEELSAEEYSQLVTAHLLKKDRHILTPEDYQLAARMLGPAKFYIGRNLDLPTADAVLDLIEVAVRRLGPTLLIIDHFHIIVRNVNDTIKAQENAMKRILVLAAKYKLKVILIGQPRKSNQQNRGKRVHISDAKGSECFTSDSHAVIALHRDLVKNFDPANPPREPYEPKTEVHLQKGRSQGTGAAYAELFFIGELASFENIAHNPPPGQSDLPLAASK